MTNNVSISIGQEDSELIKKLIKILNTSQLRPTKK